MAVDMFLKIENIKGESTDEFHKDEIEILSFSWGVSNPGSHAGGGGGGAGKVSMNDISFVHSVDKSSPQLMQHCCTGKHIKDGILSVRKSGGRSDYLKYKFYDLLISSYSLGGSSDDRPMEEVSLNFSKVEVNLYDDQGKQLESATCGGKAGKSGSAR